MARLRVEIECRMHCFMEITVPNVDAEAPVNWEDLPDVDDAVVSRRLPAGVWQHEARDRRIVRIDRLA